MPLRAKRTALYAVLAVSFVVLGGYIFIGVTTVPCFYSCPAPTIEINSIILHAGSLPISPTCTTTNSAYISFQSNNPSVATNIFSVNITGSSLTTAVTSYYLKGGVCTQISLLAQPTVPAKSTTSYIIYFGASSGSLLTSGKNFGYVVNFDNGQSISGSLLAQ